MDFLPLALESGLMHIIERWVVGQAIKDLGHLVSHGIDLPVAINLVSSRVE